MNTPIRDEAFWLQALENGHRGTKECLNNAEMSRLEFLGDRIFEFTTYDSTMAELFAQKAVEFVHALLWRTAFSYIEKGDEEDYPWFLFMANTRFFEPHLTWGSSVRGARWQPRYPKKQGYQEGYYIAASSMEDEKGEQLCEMYLTTEESVAYLHAIVSFSQHEVDHGQAIKSVIKALKLPLGEIHGPDFNTEAFKAMHSDEEFLTGFKAVLPVKETDWFTPVVEVALTRSGKSIIPYVDFHVLAIDAMPIDQRKPTEGGWYAVAAETIARIAVALRWSPVGITEFKIDKAIVRPFQMTTHLDVMDQEQKTLSTELVKNFLSGMQASLKEPSEFILTVEDIGDGSVH